MSRPAAVWAVIPPAIILPVTPAVAQHAAFDLPAGPLGAALDALAHQAGISVVIADAALWQRRVPAVRGRMTIGAAVRALARHAGVDAQQLSATSWRMTRRRPGVVAPPPARVSPGIAPPADDIVVLASKLGTLESRMANSVEVIAAPRIGSEAGTNALVTQTTSLSSSYRGPGRDKLFIGGIADSSYASRLPSVTGQYFGDVRLTYNAPDPDLQLYDVASVEVLQGPQGTLYGSGAMGGVVRINPNMPKRGRTQGAIGGGTSLVAHGGAGFDADAMVNLPLSSDLALRVVGYGRSEAGYIDNPAIGRDLNRTHIGGARALLRWWPRDGWTVDGTVIAQTIRARDNAYATDAAPPLTNVASESEPFGSDYRAAHLVVTGNIGAIRIVSATGIADQRFQERWVDDRASPFVTTLADTERRQKMATHETRISQATEAGSGWLAGIAVTDSRSMFGADSLLRGYDKTLLHQSIMNDDMELAVFGEVSLAIAPAVTVSGGLRRTYIRTKQKYLRGTPLSSALPPEAWIRSRSDEHWTLPTASIFAALTPELSLYARYQTGRRANVPLDVFSGFPKAGPLEQVDMANAGGRWKPSKTIAMTLSLQRGRWRNLRYDAWEGFFGPAPVSTGDWRITRAEGTLDWAVTGDLRFRAAASINRHTPANELARESEKPFVDIPIWIARAEIDWTRPVGRVLDLRLNGWLRYQSRSDWNLAGKTQGDYVQSGATADLVHGSDTLTIAVTNLFDSRGNRFVLGSLVRAGSTSTPLPPRTFRMGLRRSF